MLDSLTWDGKEHIRSLLPEYLGAEDSDYTYQVMRLWMLGAVSRVYKPGSKFDYTIILQGSQGIGKSTFLKLMALDDSWFNDSLDSLDSDKAVQSLTGSWIIELAELKSLARTAGGVESVKRFLTATQDKYRIPYERRADTFYRQCVFAGTTNKDDFLQDETGNRRFLIVQTGVKKPSKSLFVPEIMDTIKLAWAEAVHIWKNEKPQLILPEAYSLQVAEKFGKEHKNVLQSIDNLIAENSAVKIMFKISSYKSGNGQSYRKFYMNRDGFSLLAMGFTGREALEWKLQYIRAFNQMENFIREKSTQMWIETRKVNILVR